MKQLFSALLFLGVIQVSFSQTNFESIEQNYLQFFNAVSPLNPGDQMPLAYYNEGVSSINSIYSSGSSSDQLVAQHYQLLYEYAYMRGLMNTKNYEAAVNLYLKLNLDRLFSYNYPLVFTKNNSQFQLTPVNLNELKSNVIVSAIEAAFYAKKYELIANMIQKFESTSNHSTENEYIVYYVAVYMNDIKSVNYKNILNDLLQKEEQAVMPPTQLSLYALKSIRAFTELPQQKKEKIILEKTNSYQIGVLALINNFDSQSAEYIQNAYKAVDLASQIDANSLTILNLYGKLLSVYSTQKPAYPLNFLLQANNYAKATSSENYQSSKQIGVFALQQIEAVMDRNACETYDALNQAFTFWNENLEALKYAALAENCYSKRVDDELKLARKNRRIANNFNLYSGIYVLPLIANKTKRDFGGVINFTYRKIGLEFSYMKINKNLENTFDTWARSINASSDDISRWNGYYAHTQLKIFPNKDGFYIGFLAGQCRKNFEPYNLSYCDLAKVNFYQKTFSPKVEQYIGMVNFGGLNLLKGMGIDYYLGLGVNYSKFNWGDTPIDQSQYLVQNQLFANRKSSYFGYIMRFGLTIGLNFGRGNMN